MTGYQSKKAAAQAIDKVDWVDHEPDGRGAAAQGKLNDDDDIQVYQRTWVYLTDEHIKEIVGPYGDMPIKGYTRKLVDQIEAKSKELNA